MSHPSQHLLFMLKAPRAGQVKTRLAHTVGEASARAIYQKLVEHNFSKTPGDWQRGVFYTPNDAEATMSEWLKSADYFQPQPEGDLGVRMLRAVEHAFTNGAKYAALLGGDCPYINIALLKEGFSALAHHDVVVGPSPDGGYYTLLLKTVHPALFKNIAWSTDSVFEQTMKKIQELGLRVACLPEHEDVDTLDAWERACEAYSTLRI